MNERISSHLEAAFRHLSEALQLSVEAVSKDAKLKAAIGPLWEQFLGRFFDAIRFHSKESKLNLLSWVSFSKMWR